MSLSTSLSTRFLSSHFFFEQFRNNPNKKNRQLIRICRRMNIYPNESIYHSIHKVCLSRFLPNLAQNTLNTLLKKSGINDLQSENEDVSFPFSFSFFFFLFSFFFSFQTLTFYFI